MKKAQLSIEAVGAVSVVLILYASAVGLGLRIQEETMDRTTLLSRDIRCSDLSAVVDEVYSSGPGAQVIFDVVGNFTVRPGLVELGTTDNTYYCVINQNAVKGMHTLSQRTYTLKNEGGVVEFQ